MQAEDWIKLGAEIVAGASFVHTFLLPPWEMLNEFPSAQRYYRLFVYLVGYVALNGRSVVYPSISTADGTKPSKAANGNGTYKGEHP